MPSKITLELNFPLPDFPSGSALSYKNGKLYVSGDDAEKVIVLDKDYKLLDELQLFDFPEKRIPKAVKMDIESSTFVSINGQEHLLLMGSASTEKRKKLALVPLRGSGGFDDRSTVQFVDTNLFIARLVTAGIPKVNIEGAAAKKDHILFSNRSNLKNPLNHLIIADNNFWNRQKDCKFFVSILKLPIKTNGSCGISGLCFIESNDLLLFTASTEETDDAYKDGPVGASYLGWINNISRKIRQPEILADALLSLPACNAAFHGEKIEGLCVESVAGNMFILHLVSDNDQGESKLFKVQLSI